MSVGTLSPLGVVPFAMCSTMKREGVKNAVLIMFKPKVTPDKVMCVLNVMSAKILHRTAKRIPPKGIKIDKLENTNATIARAFICFPLVKSLMMLGRNWQDVIAEFISGVASEIDLINI